MAKEDYKGQKRVQEVLGRLDKKKSGDKKKSSGTASKKKAPAKKTQEKKTKSTWGAMKKAVKQHKKDLKK